MKQIIFLFMLISSAYAQKFYLADCMLKSRKTVESIIKPKEATPLSMNDRFDTYRYDDTILVTYEYNVCTYIEVTSNIKFVAAQTKYTFDTFVTDKDMVFNKVFIYDKYKNQYLIDVFNDGTKEYSVSIQLMSKTPDRPIK